MYSSVEEFMSMVKSKNANEVEFHQAVHEVAAVTGIFRKEAVCEEILSVNLNHKEATMKIISLF